MFAQIHPKRETLLPKTHVSAGYHRPVVTDAPVEFNLLVSNPNARVDTLRAWRIDLTREDAERLVKELLVALTQKPATSEEVRNHHEHKAWQVEKDRGW